MDAIFKNKNMHDKYFFGVGNADGDENIFFNLQDISMIAISVGEQKKGLSGGERYC